jgi:uncharacterized protein with GYD domain
MYLGSRVNGVRRILLKGHRAASSALREPGDQFWLRVGRGLNLPGRMEKVNKEIAEFGCKVISQYAVLGQCDFVTIVEAADNATVAHLSVDLGSRGTVNITPLPAIPVAELRAKMKGPKQMGRA